MFLFATKNSPTLTAVLKELLFFGQSRAMIVILRPFCFRECMCAKLVRFSLQDSEDKLMKEADIHAQANYCFHFRSQPPINQWLTRQQSQQDKARLTAIGNMVIPKCARLALHIFAVSHLQQLRRECLALILDAVCQCVFGIDV